jgi:hypothetical protein
MVHLLCGFNYGKSIRSGRDIGRKKEAAIRKPLPLKKPRSGYFIDVEHFETARASFQVLSQIIAP